MAEFEIRRTVPADPRAVWAAATSWAAYARWIPLTRIEQDAGDPDVGWSFTGVSGVGPVLLRDPMRLTLWSPPDAAGRAAFSLIKTGRVLAGWAHIEVEPVSGGTRLTWRELVVPRPQRLGVRLSPLLNPVNKILYGRVVDGIAADAIAASPPSA